jgi:hypothetical protein
MKLVNRAKMTITAVASSGTGTLTLGAASAGGFNTFADAGVANGETVRYTIEGPGDLFEIGAGVYTASGTTLSRSPSESSNANNSAITATTDSVVFVTAAAADLGPTVHSTIDGLVAQTGMTVGDTALITGTNKLYMYTTSGWFLVATMTNTSPSAITGAAASYTLATDGTATVVTLAATDPEGFPITFSHTVSTGSLGSTATVTQGTGANANVFTVTPSSNSAHAGSFSLTFSASDGNSVSQAISAFSLSFSRPANLANTSYDNVSFSIAAQDSIPRSITFNTDGTRLFLVGDSGNSIYQSSLSTGFDLSTASYDNVSFSVANQDTVPWGIAFNTDGTKMYISGNQNDRIHQYGLTSGFDLSTASYDNVSFSVSSQDGSPRAISFNSDGTLLYLMGGSDNVFEFNLTTGFDLSTASYSNVSFSVTSQNNNPYGLGFSSDGSKMYVLGANDTAFQYSLSSDFDISTASYDNVSFNFNSQETGPSGITFNSAGTKMYMVGFETDTIYQYSV